MIPKYNQSGVLPPFIDEIGPTDPASMAPYKASIVEFVARYNTTPERKNILKGLLDYRAKLRSLGVSDGFQWLDGSFVEDVETTRGRPPSDIDLVTFAGRPPDAIEQKGWENLVSQNLDLFLPKNTKTLYNCDAYFVDLSVPPAYLVSTTRYWFGLFSHQRESYLWKGMIEIPLLCDDQLALEILEREVSNA